MKNKKLKIGSKLHVWWNTGVKTHDDKNVATVITILPYTGHFDFFNCVLRLTSSNHRGWTEMAYKKEDYEFDAP